MPDTVATAFERYARAKTYGGQYPYPSLSSESFRAGYAVVEAEVRALREALGATWWVHDGKGVYWCGVCDGGELTLSPPPSPPWDERIAGIEHEPHCIVPRALAPEPAEAIDSTPPASG